MNSSSRRIFWATALIYAIPTLAHFIDPLITSARFEARQAFAAPAPTPAPTHPRHFARVEVRGDDITKYTVTYAPNSTCGYLSGSVQIPITCENKGVCLWELEYFRFIACEINEDTGLAHTKCLQRDEALDPNLCDDVCVSNTYNLFCTNETEPYCRTYAFPKGVRDYRCASTPATRVSSADFTYNDQDYPVFTTSTFTKEDSPPTPGSSGSFTTATEIATTETTTTQTRSEVASSSTTEPKADGKSGSTNVAAVAGGSVGGVVMIALGIGLYFCLRRRRKGNTDPSGPPVQEKTLPHDPAKDYVPPYISTSSPTSASASSTEFRNRNLISPMTVPSVIDQLEVVHDSEDHYGQRLSSTQETDPDSPYNVGAAR